MGKWNNRRWVPCRRYNAERPPSPRTYYQTKVNPQDILKSSLLSWEEKFCILAGVSWERVVAAKKYIYCHDNVFKWNYTAGRFALFNAKERFWAMINGVPSDAPVPNPNMYIDNIDWNSNIDPRLISDLDKQYFNPDEEDNSAPDPTVG